MRRRGTVVLSLNQLTMIAVLAVVGTLLLIAVLMAPTAETARPLGSAPHETTSAQERLAINNESSARTQVLAGFGLFSLWVIAGSYSIARSRGSREFRFGGAPPAPGRPPSSAINSET